MLVSSKINCDTDSDIENSKKKKSIVKLTEEPEYYISICTLLAQSPINLTNQLSKSKHTYEQIVARNGHSKSDKD